MTDVALQVNALAMRFGRRWIFKELSFTCRQGDVCLVTGANGCGKTTLLKILSGLLRPSGGAVDYRCAGKPVAGQALRAFVGLLTPDLTLYDELSVLENVRFFSRLRGLSLHRDDWIDRIRGVGLGRAVGLRYRFLSTGMKQRLKLLLATLHRPSLLLLDEPTANLDPDGTQQVHDFIMQYKRDHIVLLTSHRAQEMAWGDTHVKLDQPGPAGL